MTSPSLTLHIIDFFVSAPYIGVMFLKHCKLKHLNPIPPTTQPTEKYIRFIRLIHSCLA